MTFSLAWNEVAALQRSTDDAGPGPMQAAHHRLYDGLRGFVRGTCAAIAPG